MYSLGELSISEFDIIQACLEQRNRLAHGYIQKLNYQVLPTFIMLDDFLSDIEKARLKWRLNKVLVDSRKVICRTFDQLARDIRNRLSRYPKIL
ncbi:MAG: hypothetical protein ACKO3K_18370 [Cuspidothrix sp.]